MIRALEEKRFFCFCDHPGCNKVRDSFEDRAWRMKGIVFGIHPVTLYRLGRPVKCVQRYYHFCEEHFPFYLTLVLSLLDKVRAGNVSISSSPDFISSMGCWTTITDVLGGPAPINYQMDIRAHEVIFDYFSAVAEGKKE